MKYKVGDKVRIQSKEWYESHKNKFGKVWTDCLSGEGTICFDQDNAKYCGKEVIIFSVELDNYVLRGIPYEWTDEMIEGLVEEETFIKLTGKAIKNNEILVGLDAWNLPDGYIFKDENGNVINTAKIILEKKKKEYPKTYEECCKVLGFLNVDLCFNAEYRSFDASKEQWKKLGLMNQLYQLLVCRDAYWKIAGEEMGLGKPWEPDYSGTFEHGTPIKYVIYNIGTHIVKERKSSPNHILSFPTEEMRDAFCENFKELIDQCKELL